MKVKINKVLQLFLDELQLTTAPTTFVRKACQIKLFFSYLQANKLNFRRATKLIVEAYLHSLSGANLSKQQHCQVISQFYDFLGKENNPAKEFVFLKDKKLKLTKILSDKKIIQKIKNCLALNTEISIRNALIAELAYGSGLRLAELTNLNIEDLDTEKRTVHVLGKGNRERIVPITSSTIRAFREYLQRWQRFSGPLFVSKETQRRLHIKRIYQIIKENFNVRPHQLRHACASHMLKNGCSIRFIQEILGHYRLTSTQIYTNFNKDELRNVIEKCHPAKNRCFIVTCTGNVTTKAVSSAL